jgi:hypothetical protein
VRNEYTISVGKSQLKTELGRPRCRWEDGWKLDLGEIGCGSVDLIYVVYYSNEWRIIGQYGKKPSGSVRNSYFLV